MLLLSSARWWESADVLPKSIQDANIWRLAIAQALAGANSTVIYATGAIVGDRLAPSPALATLPISILVVGMAASILPAGAIARRYGRRPAFILGSAAGVLTGLVAAVAVVVGSFGLFCLSTFLGGAYAAVVLSFRFAAADGVDPSRRPLALALVMGGGVAAGVVGPQLIDGTMAAWAAYPFAATFVAQALMAAVAGLVLLGVHAPSPMASSTDGARPLRRIAADPRFIAAAMCGAASYMVMNFLMTAAPLAMKMSGHSQHAANLGIQWHVIAMYGPSFFTGRLITRFGASRIAALGLVLTALAVAIGLQGAHVMHFWWMLITLGVGWNFGFLGASALVLACHTPEEKTQVQSLNDFIVFGLMVAGSLSSGALLAAYGWSAVLWVSLGPLLASAAAFATLGRRKGTPHADGARA
ncbi:MAG: MFS transporter [Luteibacter sp.]|uniref:MFS transporter n=1 Tax=Luteibacter sp. TaxID=1886636 RepID=UPI0028067570|nr:MFS transporter [Luteibacter sp.]MDQ7995256.1 MFS transporter [Luteibacter sp.]